MCQFVPNFVSYVPAKYYLNWFTAEKVIAKIIRMNFFETQYTSLCIVVRSNRNKLCLLYSYVSVVQRW